MFVAASGLVALTIFGLYSVLLNLYLLRLGYGPEFIGLVQGTGIMAISVLSMPASAAGRRWGLNRVIIAGLSAGSLALVALSLSDLAPESIRAAWILVFNFAGTTAMTMYYVNSNPYQMAITTEADRTYHFAIRWAMVSLGGFVGSMFAGFLPGVFTLIPGVEPDSAGAFRLALLTGALLLLLAPLAMFAGRPPHAARATARRGPSEPAPLKLFAAIALVVLLWTASMAVGRTFFNIYMDSALTVSTPRIGLVIAAAQITAAPAALLMPRLVRRAGRGNASALGFLVAALTMLPLALIPNWAAAGAALMVLSVIGAIVEPAFSMFTLSLVPDSWRPAMAGVTITSGAASFGLISLAGGYVIAGLGYGFLFLGAAGVSVIGVALFWLLFVRGSRFEFAG